MKPPILIIEGGDISVHPSIEHVAAFLETPDVTDGIFTAYDSEGWLLDLNVKNFERERHFLWFRWVISQQGIIVSKHEPPTDCSAELRRKLIDYLNAVSKRKKLDIEIPAESLDQLIRAAGRFMPWRVLSRDA